MLVTLAIKDLAIIDDATIELRPGLNVLTGETGAGKSMIIEALSLILGDRARIDTIRRGAERAEVSGIFRLAPDQKARAALARLELVDEGDGDELIVRRVIAPSGKGRVFINGRVSTVANLAEVTRGLIDISSQHAHTQLLDASSHLDLLDRFGALGPARARYEEAYAGLLRAREKRASLAQRERERVAREDFARFQLGEIAAAKPRVNEDDELDAEQRRLAHAEALLAGTHEAADKLGQGHRSATELLDAAARQIEKLSHYDAGLEPVVARLEALRIELDDVARELAGYAAGLEVDPDRLAEVNERLELLDRLKRKYGGDLAAVLATAERLEAEVRAFASLEEAKGAAEREVARCEASAREAAGVLSEGRGAAATALGAEVAAELHGLAMGGAAVRFHLERHAELGARGVDAGELHIQTNVGEGFGPLVRVASGGELSRVLLALKRVLMHIDPVATCIFDEVDTGTGGAVADVIGQKLQEIAAERQVIVISHLAQIAARGSHHLRVEKQVQGERTVTRVRPLDRDERAEEIARMLGGLAITPRVRAHAAELLGRD